MEQFAKNQSQSFIIYVGNNLIDRDGVKTLCDNNWAQLEELLLSLSSNI